jgi:hypothetical protein
MRSFDALSFTKPLFSVWPTVYLHAHFCHIFSVITCGSQQNKFWIFELSFSDSNALLPWLFGINSAILCEFTENLDYHLS